MSSVREPKNRSSRNATRYELDQQVASDDARTTRPRGTLGPSSRPPVCSARLSSRWVARRRARSGRRSSARQKCLRASESSEPVGLPISSAGGRRRARAIASCCTIPVEQFATRWEANSPSFAPARRDGPPTARPTPVPEPQPLYRFSARQAQIEGALRTATRRRANWAASEPAAAFDRDVSSSARASRRRSGGSFLADPFGPRSWWALRRARR